MRSEQGYPHSYQDGYPRGHHQDVFGLWLNLLLGPHDGDGVWSEAQLRRGWAVYRGKLMERRNSASRPADRPWGYWRFLLDEEPPASYPEQLARLLELGDLSGEEVVAVERRALEALKSIEQMNHWDDIGAVKSGPTEVASEMRFERARDAAAWRRVLGAL